MSAIAKRFIGGEATATECHGRFVRGQNKRLAFGVDDANRPFHDKRSIIPDADRNVSHTAKLPRQETG